MLMNFPVRLFFMKSRVRFFISSGQVKCHQKRNATKNPPPPYRHESPADLYLVSLSTVCAIGVTHLIPFAKSKHCLMKNSSSRSVWFIRYFALNRCCAWAVFLIAQFISVTSACVESLERPFLDFVFLINSLKPVSYTHLTLPTN